MALASEPAEVFQAPDWTIGYYATLWTPDISRANGGDETTLGVQFTGEWLITPALTALGIKSEECDATQMSWCDGQVTYAVSTGKSADEARKATIEEVDSCAQCLMTEEDKKTMAPPFSARARIPITAARSTSHWAEAPTRRTGKSARCLMTLSTAARRSPRSRRRGLLECASTSRGPKEARS